MNEGDPHRNFSLPKYLSVAILVFSVAFYFVGVYRKHIERWDDAYITFRFAQHLAEGQGLIWNVGGERVEGFTSFFHVLLLAGGIKGGIDPWIGSLILSIIAVLVTAALILAIAWRQTGSLSPLSAAIVGIYLIDATTIIHTTSGLETQVFVALLCICYFLAFLFIERSSWLLSILLGLAVFVSCLCRPEAVIYGAAIYLVLAVYCLRLWLSKKNSERFLKLILSGGIVALAGLFYVVWKDNYFGYILPNPFYVKSDEVSLAGLSEVTAYLKHLIIWFGPLLLVSVVVLLFGVRRKEPTILSRASNAIGFKESFFSKSEIGAKIFLTFLPPILALAYYMTIVHEVGGAYRFSYPTYFYFVLGLAVFLPILISAASVSRLGEFALSAVAIVSLGALFINQKNWQTAPMSPSAFNQYHFKIADALKETGLGSRATVLCDSAGIIPYVSGFNQVDRVGLVDNYLSGRKPSTAVEREAYIWSRPLDVYVGNEPPAQPGAERPEEDSRMQSQYVSQILLHKELTLVESRIFQQDPQLLYARMRELRDNWYFLGEIQSPGWKAWKVKSFLYVRRDSPYTEQLTSKLGSIIEHGPDQIDLNDIDLQ